MRGLVMKDGKWTYATPSHKRNTSQLERSTIRAIPDRIQRGVQTTAMNWVSVERQVKEGEEDDLVMQYEGVEEYWV